MNVQKVELFNGGGNCNYALVWELDKFIVIVDDMITVWRSEDDYFAAMNGEVDFLPLEILEYNQKRIGE